MKLFKHSLLSTAVLGVFFTGLAGAQDTATLSEVKIIGEQSDAQVLPGSGAVVGADQMEVEVASDVHQVLKTVPGIYIREEDGYGLRPNIGIRGATAERSANVTLMEDGVLIAPSPYASPAAYYIPTTLRMNSIEVLKGAPLLRHGPQTTGGVINFVSTPIPETLSGRATLAIGQDGTNDTHVYVGDGSGPWQFLIEGVQRNTDGFKTIDRSGRDSGFSLSDYVAKLGWKGNSQRVLLKVQQSDETSDETYLGLTDADFNANPNRRYGLSEIDQIKTDHKGYSLTHTIDLNEKVSVVSTLYRNEFKRNWFKLNGGSAFIDAANQGDANAQGILDGTVDTTGLVYRNNNRKYLSEGFQSNLTWKAGRHIVNAGFRVHEDSEDRFQADDIFDQVNGSLVFSNRIEPSGGGTNRLEEAEALSLWITDDWQVSEKLNLHLALRHEDVDTRRTQFGNFDRTVTVPNNFNNSVSELLPGISATYQLQNNVQVLAGYHKGFSPLGGGSLPNEEPETSDNYEFGARFNQGTLFAEAIGFYSDFNNKTENCSVGTPCSDGSTSGSFTTGNAEIYGLEFQLGNSLRMGNFDVPLNVAYTYTVAEISENNSVTGLQKGDRLKDVPEQVFSVRAGLEHASGWDNYAVVKYLSDLCTNAGCNRTGDAFDKTDKLTVVDLISRYPLNKDTTVFLKVENALDEQKIVARVPDGARPNKPRTVIAGVSVNF